MSEMEIKAVAEALQTKGIFNGSLKITDCQLAEGLAGAAITALDAYRASLSIEGNEG